MAKKSDRTKDYANQLLESSTGNGRTVMSEKQAWFLARHAIDEGLGKAYIDELAGRGLTRQETSEVVGEIIGNDDEDEE
jgi:hypothetical protein